MKKVLYIIFACLLSLFAITVDAATCTNEEKAKLKKEAALIKFVYEEETGVMDSSQFITTDDEHDSEIIEKTYDYFKISISNIPKYFNLQISNDYDDNIDYIFGYQADKGVYSFDWLGMEKVVHHKLVINAGSDSNCSGEQIATLYLTTPRYNYWADTLYCEGLSEQDFCKKYTSADLSQDELLEKIKEYIEQQENVVSTKTRWYQKLFAIINKHKAAIIIGLIAGAGVGVTLVIIKRKRRVN